MTPRHLFLGAFVITIGFITFEEFKKCHELPWPPRIIGAGLAFGLLDLLSIVQAELAGVIAIGFTLATVVNTLSPNEGTSQMFTANCQHAEATAQTNQFNSLDTGGGQQAI